MAESHRRALRGLKRRAYRALVFRVMYPLVGTEVFRHRGTLHCIDCGSRIKLRTLLRREWRFTACPSCEGFEHVMRNLPLPERCR